jgi:hypothetical protein
VIATRFWGDVPASHLPDLFRRAAPALQPRIAGDRRPRQRRPVIRQSHQTPITATSTATPQPQLHPKRLRLPPRLAAQAAVIGRLTVRWNGSWRPTGVRISALAHLQDVLLAAPAIPTCLNAAPVPRPLHQRQHRTVLGSSTGNMYLRRAKMAHSIHTGSNCRESVNPTAARSPAWNRTLST